MRHFDVGIFNKLLGGGVKAGAHAGRAEVELSRGCLRLVNELPQRLDAGSRVSVDQIVRFHDHVQVAQILDRVVGHIGRQRRSGHHASVGHHTNGVAVFGRLGQCVGADALTSTSLVFDHHGLAQNSARFGGHHPCIAVYDAGREGHDHIDRLVGVITLGVTDCGPKAGE